MCTVPWCRFMGSALPKATEDEQKRSQAIDKILANARKENANIFKLLLLGPGDSGKSTILKQMRILHANGFSQGEIALQQSVIAGNILCAISAILKAMTEFGIKFELAERESDADHLRAIEKQWTYGGQLNPGDWACLKRLWKDPGLQKCFSRANEFQVADSTQYFCDQMDRIESSDFVPNEQDMLRSRMATLGIVEFEFTLRGLTLRVIDVGGQRSQRKKWIHCFENINALIFVTALSEYNQVLLEDNRMNRMQESIKLFGIVINCQWFTNTNVVMFLNKKDLFEEKLKRFPLSDIFPEYKGGSDYNEGAKFIENLFYKQKSNKDKMIYCHRTCATDTKNVEFVLDACFDIILTGTLSRTGMLM